MEYRTIFDKIPDEFDKYRPRYSKELFDFLIDYANINERTDVLELGPGTGQATDYILNTGCNYLGIELGKNFYKKMIDKYGRYNNFSIINDDFITHKFDKKFDMIYSAATIQWINEKIAFSKTYELLKDGGILAMMLTIDDYKTPNESLYNEIQEIYNKYFKPKVKYQDMKEPFDYTHATDYGYIDFEKYVFNGKRELNADEFVEYSKTHVTHIILEEPYRSKFFDGIRKVILKYNNKIVINESYVLYTAKKKGK